MTSDLQASLLAAIVDEQPGAINEMIANGADPNEPLPNDTRSLHVAISFRASPRVVQALLDQGADPDMVSPDGVPALVAAIQAAPNDGNLETVKLLLDAGADVELRDPDGHTAVDIARQLGSSETAEALAAAVSAEAD